MLPAYAQSCPDTGTAAGGEAEALRSAAGPGYAREWALFCDYAAATGQPALPTTVHALSGFLTQVSGRGTTLARRAAAIAAAHRSAGYFLERPTPAADNPENIPTRTRQAGLSPTPRPNPKQMISACPTRGWPHGFVGRRDAFLVVLTVVLGYSHTQARLIRPGDLTTSHDAPGTMQIRGRALASTEDARSCPACAVVRWLEILGVADGLGRGSARMQLSAAEAPTSASPHRHTLAGPSRWSAAAHLLPAIDRHGWIDDYRPLSTRSIRTRLALAASRADSPGALITDTTTDGDAHAGSAEPSAPPDSARSAPSLDEVLALLDQVAADADAVNHRIEALLTNPP